MRSRIVVVDGSTAVTGGLRGADRLARLLSLWVDTTLVLPSESKVPATELTGFDRVAYLPIRSLRKTVVAVVTYLPMLLAAGWRLRRMLAREQADILVLNDFTLAQGAIVRALGYNGRIVTWVRFDPTRFPRLLSRTWLGSAFWASDAVIAVSDFIYGLLPPSPILCRIYDSIDLDLPDQMPSADVGDVVCIANYIEGKGQDHAIAAFSLIADEFPHHRLVLYGGDMGLNKNRQYIDALMNQAATRNIGERVVFRPFTTDVASALDTAAVALVLSQSESFGLSCLEASQLGVPVVAYRSGGPAEIIVDGVTGYLCQLGAIQEVARALHALLRDPDKARTMGRAGFAYVREKFGRDRFIDKARRALDLSSIS